MAYADAVLALSNLEGYWRLEETQGTTAADSSGKNRPLTYTGNPTLNRPSLLPGDPDGRSVEFNGSSQYASRPALPMGSNLTLIAWGKPDTLPSGASAFRTIAGNAESYVVRIGSRNNVVRWEGFVRVGATYHTVIGNQAPTAGTTYMVALVYAGTQLRLYVNGAQQAAISASGTPQTGFGFHIGWEGGGNYWDGHIDEVAVVSRALTPEEIADLYEIGITKPVRIVDAADVTLAAAASLAGVGGVDRPAKPAAFTGLTTAAGAGVLLASASPAVLAGQSQAAGAGTLLCQGGATLTAHAELAGAGTLDVAAEPATLTGEAAVAGAGAADRAGGTHLTARSQLAGTGSLLAAGGTDLQAGSDFTGHGTVTLAAKPSHHAGVSSFTGAGQRILGARPAHLTATASFTGHGSARINAAPTGLAAVSDWAGIGDKVGVVDAAPAAFTARAGMLGAGARQVSAPAVSLTGDSTMEGAGGVLVNGGADLHATSHAHGHGAVRIATRPTHLGGRSELVGAGGRIIPGGGGFLAAAAWLVAPERGTPTVKVTHQPTGGIALADSQLGAIQTSVFPRGNVEVSEDG